MIPNMGAHECHVFKNLVGVELLNTCFSISTADAASLLFKTDLSFSQLSISVSKKKKKTKRQELHE